MQKYLKNLQSIKKKARAIFVILLFGELLFLPIFYIIALSSPTYIGSFTAEFNIYLMLKEARYDHWGNKTVIGIGGGGINVFHAKKGYYFELESIYFLYMNNEVKAEELTKRNDYTFQWFINHTIVQFRSEYDDSYTNEHFFGNFNNSLRELILLQSIWRSNVLNHTLNQEGTASTPVDFFAYINGSPDNDENVNLTAFNQRCKYIYITYALLWKKDYYYAFESIVWLIILALIIDIAVLLLKWSFDKGYLKRKYSCSSSMLIK